MQYPVADKAVKYNAALDFIKSYVTSNYLNTIPDKSGCNSSNGNGDIPLKELPFKTNICFLKEMELHYVERGLSIESLPSYSVFCRAYDDYNSSPNCKCKTRFLRDKGAHATCEVCINCSKILQEKGKRFGSKGKDVIRKYRNTHMTMQDNERDELNANRAKARRRECAFFFGDFMSEYATKLPHVTYYGNNHSKEDASSKSIGMRLYGVEVIYGNIEGIFCYLVPGYLPGGNDCMFCFLCQLIISKIVSMLSRWKYNS